MKAAVFDGKKLLVKDVPKPTIGKNQALVQIRACGICGTDLAIEQGHLPTPVPLILGHELAGEVVAIGEKVKKTWMKKRVTSEINTNICGQCFYCKNGMPTQCVTRKALGIDVDGGFAEFIALNDYLLHEIPKQISYNQATFIEPTAAAYQTFEMMPVSPHDHTMAIFGMGKLGLLILQVAKTLNFDIIAIDGSEKKLALAKKFGAKTIINRHKEKDIPRFIRGLTGDIGADIVLDTTGNPNALKDVVTACRTRGKIHMKSTHGLATPLNITDIVVREITTYSSRCGPFPKAIQGMVSGKIAVDDLISATFPLDQIAIGFESYTKSRDHIKTIITMQ